MKYSKIKGITWGLPLAGHRFNVTPIATTKATNHIECMTRCTKAELEMYGYKFWSSTGTEQRAGVRTVGHHTAFEIPKKVHWETRLDIRWT